jgi:hypothetical protein
MAQIEVALGEFDQALTHLESAYNERDFDTLDDLGFSPRYDDLRSQSRFNAILAKLQGPSKGS